MIRRYLRTFCHLFLSLLPSLSSTPGRPSAAASKLSASGRCQFVYGHLATKREVLAVISGRCQIDCGGNEGQAYGHSCRSGDNDDSSSIVGKRKSVKVSDVRWPATNVIVLILPLLLLPLLFLLLFLLLLLRLAWTGLDRENNLPKRLYSLPEWGPGACEPPAAGRMRTKENAGRLTDRRSCGRRDVMQVVLHSNDDARRMPLLHTHTNTKNRIVTRVCTDEAPRRLTEIEDLGGGVRGA